MTQVKRAPGAPIQLKGSRDTLGVKPACSAEKRAAQLVVCQYVDAWYSHLDDAAKIYEVQELLDILGISGD